MKIKVVTKCEGCGKEAEMSDTRETPSGWQCVDINGFRRTCSLACAVVLEGKVAAGEKLERGVAAGSGALGPNVRVLAVCDTCGHEAPSGEAVGWHTVKIGKQELTAHTLACAVAYEQKQPPALEAPKG